MAGHELEMYYVYILQSLKDTKLYVGYTADLKNRLKEHNSGECISTNPRRPLKLIFYEAYLSKDDARRRERYFKTAKGKTTLKQMLKNYFAERG